LLRRDIRLSPKTSQVPTDQLIFFKHKHKGAGITEKWFVAGRDQERLPSLIGTPDRPSAD